MPSAALCIGLPGAGTTWLFNIMREILLGERGGGGVEAVYSDSLPCPAPGRVVLAKSHIPDAGLIAAVASGEVPAIIAVRDPRDCIVSCMDRFGYDFATAAESARDSTAAIERLLAAASIKPRIYEQDLFSTETITLAGRLLGSVRSPAEAQALLDRWAPAEVARFVAERTARAELVANPAIAGDYYDTETHWHANHAGRSGESGRWASALTGDQQRVATALFEAPYRRWLDARAAGTARA